MRTASNQVRVLLVDDDPEAAERAAAALEGRTEGFVAEAARTASEGRRRLAAGDVDCVVADYDLPEQDGLTLFRSLREEYPAVPFLLFTADGSEAVAAQALSAGVDGYVRKDGEDDPYGVLADRIDAALADKHGLAATSSSARGVDQILKTVPGCVVQLNRDGEFVYANQHAIDVLGLERDDVLERSYNDPEWKATDLDGDPIPDEDLPFRRIVESGEPLYGYEHAIEWPDGTRKVLSINGAPLFDAAGNVDGVVFSMTDNTDQRERERRLQQSTARLAALFENSPDMINVHDDEGNIIEPNTRLCEATGYSEAELTDMKVWELDSDIDPEEAQSMWRAMDVGDREQLEGTFERRDGSSFPVEVHVRCIDLDGEPRYAVISREITERLERERRLREATQQLRATIDAAADAIVVIDTEGVVQEWNPAAERMFGWSKAEVLGEYNPIVPAESEAEFQSFLEQLRAGERVTGIETKRRTKDGDRIDVSLSTAPIREDGDVVGVVGILTDITARKQRERELKRKNERLEEFASVVSHDLRNPMNVAEGNLELARADCDSDHLDTVARAHERMRALVEDLLRLAREGATVEDTEPVALAALCDGCWENVATDDATLSVATERVVRADRSRFQQLLENLMRNAVEHGGEAVTVSVGDLPDSSGFYVADDGPGIPEADRSRVFESGFTTTEDGTGFGLSIVEEIAEAHGWTVSVTEGEHGGARFEIRGVTFADA